MASKSFTKTFFSLLLVSSFAIIHMAIAGDPDIISDFVVPANVTAIDANFFTFTGMRTLVSMAEFPALNGQSVSYDVLYFPAGSINPPHTRGLIDTTNKLYTQTLQAGDMFVFPKGLVHYQYNPDAQTPAVAIAAFGSSNLGSVSVPKALFNTDIDDVVLAKSFKTDVATIQALKVGHTPKQ
ncbi:hypothetical protein RGQ29_014068 [Quercus rubra]|uniref:Germin-like protein n=1 Tax=Quercus rubra TaxID=3512 RepID=A0AAN7FS17_QUERU|nr:hypothetical protein RGQ29_014068 [Quercus rubra]